MVKPTTKLPSVDELNLVLAKLIGTNLPKPSGASLAGHAAGLPFEDMVHNSLESAYGEQVLRQYQALNTVLLNNPQAKSGEQRTALLGSSATQFLLKRGVAAMKEWGPDNLFDVKQDDTAESILFDNSDCNFSGKSIYLIDVKTQDISKKAQAPNIMSADKLARACVFALKDKKSMLFEIIYVGIKWKKTASSLECVDINAISMMRIPPSEIYINWVAAQQIQFHPFVVKQTYSGTHEEWCKEYLIKFCGSLKDRIGKEQERLKFFQDAIGN